MKAYEVTDGKDGLDNLVAVERDAPEPGPGEVILRMAASALNYRDLTSIRDPRSRGMAPPFIPNSCGAGVVTELGAETGRFQAGDRVTPTFFRGWTDGGPKSFPPGSSLGGPLDGTLAEYMCVPEHSLVAAPVHLSDVEAATLPCAGVTAWNAVMELGGIRPGDTVLLLGTGGVSIFALQFAVMAGARVIITSSSDDKLARARELGAAETVNYKATPDWNKAVLDLTGGAGVDLVVEVGGAGTLDKSAASTRPGGTVAVIGVMTQGTFNGGVILQRNLRVQGIRVGTRVMLEHMNAAIALHKMHPVVDRTFAFDDARAAYELLAAGGHFGKLVVEIP